MLAVVLSFDQFPMRLLGCYGNSTIEMPCLNQIASESIVFDQHFGEDFSLKPEGHAWWSGCFHFPREETPLFSKVPTLPEWLRSGNIECEWIQDNLHEPSIPMPRNAKSVVCKGSDTDIIDEACRLLESRLTRAEAPELVWIKVGASAWANPLGPWGSSENAVALKQLDRTVGPLWEAVRTLAQRQNVLFIFTAARGLPVRDQAEPGNEEATWTEEFVHLPLVVYHSEATGTERRSEPTQTLDIPLTLLDFFSISPPLAWEGRSFLPSVLGHDQAGRDFVTSGCEGVWDAIRTRDFHLVRVRDSEQPDGVCRRLFIKPDDVWDWHDVAAQEPEMTETLSRQLDAFYSAAGSQIPINPSALVLVGTSKAETLNTPP